MTLAITENNTLTLRSERHALVIHIPTKAQFARIWLWMKLAVVLGLVALGLLTLKSTRNTVITAGAVWLLLTTDWSRDGRKKMGLSLENFKQTAWMLELAIPCVTLIWLIGLLYGSAHLATTFDSFFFFEKFGYVLGACLQDLTIAYCFNIKEQLSNCPLNAFGFTSRLFWAFHTPNPLLMLITRWGGKRLCAMFQQERNLLTIILLHGAIGSAIAAFWPHWTVIAGIGFIPFLKKFFRFVYRLFAAA